MSSTSAPFGLRASFHPSGTIRPTRRPIAAAYTTAIYKGSPFLIAADGTVTVGATTGRADGVFVGCEYVDSTGKPNVSPYWPGTASCTNIVAYVIEDPAVVFEVQANGTLALTDIGSHAAFATGVGGGSTQTGLSSASLDIATKSATAENTLVIVDLAPYVDNAWDDTYTVVRVQLANPAFIAPAVAF